MGPYPAEVNLPYQVSSAFLEEEGLSGRFPGRDHIAHFRLAGLEPAAREQLIEVWEQLGWDPPVGYPFVHGTGIDHTSFHRADDTVEALIAPIWREIGKAPSLARPTDVSADIVTAYVRWIRRFRELSREALEQWVRRWAPEKRDTTRDEVGDDLDNWSAVITVRSQVDDAQRRIVIDGRIDVDLFARARAATIRQRCVQAEVGVGSWAAAAAIVGEDVWAEEATPLDRVVEGYEAVTGRLCRLALSHHHHEAFAERSFADEMQLWTEQHGSERLRLGLEDGYRMTAVYLEERLAAEAPGFFALRSEKTAPIGKERSGPSAFALRLRRAVQDRLDANADGESSTNAIIRWVGASETPDALISDYASVGEDSAEAIVVPRWLGRYQLIGFVREPDGWAPGWIGRTLDPGDYGLARPSLPADDDIPF